MNRICPRCRTVYSYALNGCPKGCNKRVKRESNKVYDAVQRKNQDFYSSKEWKRLREACKNKFSGLCIWTLYKHKRIVKGRIAHHIIPIDVDKDLSLKLYNLIFVSDEAHAEIHMKYSEASKDYFKDMNEEILKEIYDCLDQWLDDDKGWGV